MDCEHVDDFRRQLDGYRLTTAEILYHMPDHPSLLQSYIWQELDLVPKFPELRLFLKFWNKELDGKLYRVTVAVRAPLAPIVFACADQEFLC